LFWKKKADNNYKLIIESLEKRNFYRLKPFEKEKFFIIINSRAFEIYNISAGGAAFFGECFEIGNIYNFKLWFSDKKNDFIKGKMGVSGVDNLLWRGKFIDLDEKERERIHKFIFDRQITLIREKKYKKTNKY